MKLATVGSAASWAWLADRGLDAAKTPQWYIEAAIPADPTDTVVELNIYPEEWGFVFKSGMRVSSVRVTDTPFVHGRDDFRLLDLTPALDRFSDLLAVLGRRFAIVFHLEQISVRTNLPDATAVLRDWLGA